MNIDRQRRRQLGIIGGLLVLSAGAYSLYKYIYSSNQPSPQQSSTTDEKYTRKHITIILTDSIISSKLPINEILTKTTDVVLVIPPELTVDDLNEPLDPTIAYKAIECKGIERYVGEIIELDQNVSVINESILSSVIT
ncbi:Peroxisome assembly protein 22 [Cyberlindnera fabianii]|uniref:Peroxisome assembly protein 22 n=1 Tax=Cyberlindnera fabianii TaxID=36022 RepID=A0A1V2L9Y6_CYBFA|nr:Peroxisome assembly protein 22 [Cyberlindnera fabianii]